MGVDISMLVAIQAIVLFFFFAYLRTLSGFTLLSIPFLYGSLICFVVSLASHPSINLPNLFRKNPDGRIPIWSIIMFSPYLVVVRIFSFLLRLISDEEPYSEICEGVYVGGWPYSPEKLPPGDPAIIDCTCELPRKSEFKGHPYLCIPIWDTRAPQPGDIHSAVKWACQKRAQNRPVFIHCAYGHGRSVAVMCALLVALGVVEDWKMAEEFIKAKRPHIQMNSLHRQALEEWSRHRHRLSSPPSLEE